MNDSGRKCSVYLPNDRKLELTIQPKQLGRDLLDIVASHFKLKEKEYFGIAYNSEGGYYSWLQDEKKVLDHDIAKKTSGEIDLQFAVKYYVESVTSLKQSRSIELFFLHTRSLIYKGYLEIEENETVFELASLMIQATCGDYTDYETSVQRLSRLPVFSTKLLRELSKDYCEKTVIEQYKGLKGLTKGKCVLRYLLLAETLPSYGIHYYKVKDKTGLNFWLGLSYKGIQQFQIDDKIRPLKTFHWRQLENLYFREKKFSIEVSDSSPRINSTGSRSQLSIDKKTHVASSADLKTHAWYGSPSLVKTIWVMSISQHHYYLDRKQSKSKLTSNNNLTNLTNDLTSSTQSLIHPLKETPVMTKKQIKDVEVTEKRGSKIETPEMRAAKEEMLGALKTRRTELEDRLYDKVQELKKMCLQEADITGKLPPEYIRYMDLNEQKPKVKKRVGAEFKIKLKNKTSQKYNQDRDFPATTVTAASSSSSGFGSEATDASDELNHLETEFEILSQIANAARKLATDPNVKGRTRNKRLNSYMKCLDKLKGVEDKINLIRKRSGQKLSERTSMLFDESNDLTFDGGESGSEQSSLSDGMILDDDTSLSSGADALSTHSTPAILNRRSSPNTVGSNPGGRRKTSSADVDTNEVLAIYNNRSVTPPPSLTRVDQMVERTKHSAHPIREKLWFTTKWENPKPKQGWNESSLDSIETGSTTSRNTEEPKSPSHMRGFSPSPTRNKIKLNQPLNASQPLRVDMEPLGEADGRLSANSNQNNHNVMYSSASDVNGSFSMRKLKRDVSETALSELSVKSNPVVTVTGHDDSTLKRVSDSGLSKIDEASHRNPSDRYRRRSSSFTEPSHNTPPSDRAAPHKNKDRAQHAYHVPSGVPRQQDVAQRIKFDTNVNIRMQYLARSSGQLAGTSQAPAQRQLASRQDSAPLLDRHAPAYEQSHRGNDVARPSQQMPKPKPPLTQGQPALSSTRRDQLNNEVYSDIGMGWVPSIHEYSSRASLVESERKEVIWQLLTNRCEAKKRLSNSSSQQSKATSKHTEQTWTEYQKGLLEKGKATADRAPPSGTRTNIFQHKAAPQGLTPYKTQKKTHPRLQHQRSVSNNEPGAPPQHFYNTVHSTSSRHQRHANQAESRLGDETKQRLLNEHYRHHRQCSDPADVASRPRVGQEQTHAANSNPVYFQFSVPSKAAGAATATDPRLQAPQRWHSDDPMVALGDAGFYGAETLHHPNYLPHQYHSPPNYPHHNAPPPPVRHHEDYYVTHMRHQERRQLSASAEDLLWTDNSHDHAGTLV